MSKFDTLSEKATPRPWTTGKGTKTIRDDSGFNRAIATTATRYHPHFDQEESNAAFITALANNADAMRELWEAADEHFPTFLYPNGAESTRRGREAVEKLRPLFGESE